MSLRNRIARLAPYSRLTRGLCTDPWHELDDADDDALDDYAVDVSAPELPSVAVFGYRCPTCGFQTCRIMTKWDIRRMRLKCHIKRHPMRYMSWYDEDGTMHTRERGCDCGRRVSSYAMARAGAAAVNPSGFERGATPSVS